MRDRERSPIDLGCMGRAGSALPTADLSTATVDPRSPMAEQCFRHATWRALGGPRPEGPGPTAVSRRDHDTAHNDPKEFGTLVYRAPASALARASGADRTTRCRACTCTFLRSVRSVSTSRTPAVLGQTTPNISPICGPGAPSALSPQSSSYCSSSPSSATS